MRSRILTGALLVVTVLFVAATASDAGPTVRWAAGYLSEPTLIGSTIVQGPVLFVHDDARMARGEPCTTVRLFEPGVGPLDEVASFHCTPIRRAAARSFTITTRRNDALGFGCVLVEYQFAGDTEAHGVPMVDLAH